MSRIPEVFVNTKIIMNRIPEVLVNTTIFTASSLSGFYVGQFTKKYNSEIDGAVFCGTGLAIIYSLAKNFSNERYGILDNNVLKRNYYAGYILVSLIGGYALAKNKDTY